MYLLVQALKIRTKTIYIFMLDIQHKVAKKINRFTIIEVNMFISTIRIENY
jgi:hypothetical protein